MWPDGRLSGDLAFLSRVAPLAAHQIHIAGAVTLGIAVGHFLSFILRPEQQRLAARLASAGSFMGVGTSSWARPRILPDIGLVDSSTGLPVWCPGAAFTLPGASRDEAAHQSRAGDGRGRGIVCAVSRAARRTVAGLSHLRYSPPLSTSGSATTSSSASSLGPALDPWQPGPCTACRRGSPLGRFTAGARTAEAREREGDGRREEMTSCLGARACGAWGGGGRGQRGGPPGTYAANRKHASADREREELHTAVASIMPAVNVRLSLGPWACTALQSGS